MMEVSCGLKIIRNKNPNESMICNTQDLLSGKMHYGKKLKMEII